MLQSLVNEKSIYFLHGKYRVHASFLSHDSHSTTKQGFSIASMDKCEYVNYYSRVKYGFCMNLDYYSTRIQDMTPNFLSTKQILVMMNILLEIVLYFNSLLP